MTKKGEELYIKRADKFCAGLEDKWIIESVPFKAEFSRSKDPVPFNKRADGEIHGRRFRQGKTGVPNGIVPGFISVVRFLLPGKVQLWPPNWILMGKLFFLMKKVKPFRD
jgi:hypothetical protein